jgi:ATP-dependent Lon protease
MVKSKKIVCVNLRNGGEVYYTRKLCEGDGEKDLQNALKHADRWANSSVSNKSKFFEFLTSELKVEAPPEINTTRIQGKLSSDDYKSLHKLTEEEHDRVEQSSKECYTADDGRSTRVRLLLSSLPVHVKKRILLKLDKTNEHGNSSGDYVKFNIWVECMLLLPLGIILTPVVDTDISARLSEGKAFLDRILHGHLSAKQAIIEIYFQWLRLPNVAPKPLALVGRPGTGKTTIIKNGLSCLLGKPFNMISLGGATDSSFLNGFSYSYEGSMVGKIADCVTVSRAMNPVLYFDELDKVSRTSKGEEIINTLIHLTDNSQNSEFFDRYLGMPLDLSVAHLAFSFNDVAAISPILLDRLRVVEMDEPTKTDYYHIVKNFVIPQQLRELCVTEKVLLDDESVMYLASMAIAQGVRTIIRVVNSLLQKFLLMCSGASDDLLYPLNSKHFVPKDGVTLLTIESVRICCPHDNTHSSLYI